MKPVVLYTRPAAWRRFESDKLNLIYVPLAGSRPVRKSGKPAGDGPLALANKDGIERLVNAMRKHQPQVLLRAVNTGMSRTAHERVREASPKTVIMLMDGNEPTGLSKYAERYGIERGLIDMYLLNSRDERVLGKYRDAGLKVATLYDGFDPAEHKPNPKQPRADCFFGGSNRRRKVPRNDPLTGFTREVWEWDFPNGQFRFDFISHARMRYRLNLHGASKEWPYQVKPILHYPAYFKAFQRAKIALGCNHYDLERYYTRRVMHAGASGRAFVTRYIPGMEKDFGENGKHVAWFKTVDGGLATIERLLKDEKGRVAMGRRCRRLFIRDHSWEARLREFEKIVKDFV